jgi:hypothetical protein
MVHRQDRVLHRRLEGHRVNVIVATRAYGNYLKTVADKEQADTSVSADLS